MSNNKKVYPLSSSELGIYLDHPETTAYNLPCFFSLWQDVDMDKVKSSIKTLLDLHPHAYMRVCVDDNGNVGKYIEKCDFDVPVKKLDNLESFEPVPFEVLDAPLFRFAIYEIKDKKYLLIEFHHIVMDGTGIDVFVNDFMNIYDGKSVKNEELSAEDFTEKEIKDRQSKLYDDGKAYYEKQFGGIECSSILPYDKQDPKPVFDRILGSLCIKNAEIHSFVKEKNIKTSSFFLSVYTYLLAKMNMEKEALIATVNNGRDASLRNSFGMFVKTIPFYAQFDADTTIEEYLHANNDNIINSIEHSTYSYVDATRDLGLSIEQIFAYQGDMYSFTREGQKRDLYIPPLKDGMGNSSVLVFRDGDSFNYEIHYRADLYERETFVHLAKLFDIAAKEFLSKNKLVDIDLLTKEEKAIIDGFNTFDESLTSIKKTVIDSFYENVEKMPEKIALEFEDKQYTYAEVDIISNKIANKLLSYGIGRENVVSVLIPKCEYTLIASLGVLKTGAGYQPLDPSYPPEGLTL